MQKSFVMDYLKLNQLEDVEEIKYNEDVLVVRFYYDFDDSEIEAATAYANDECTEEEESETWYNDFFLPYLNDLVVDGVGEIIEGCSEEFELDAQFINYDIDAEEPDYVEVIAEFTDKGKLVDIEKVIEDLKL